MKKYIDPIYHYRKSQELPVDQNDLMSTLFNIELNVSEMCSRHCIFCPRNDPKVYANRDFMISEEIAERIGKHLADIDFGSNGQVISISGFGEPMMHGNIASIISIIHKAAPEAKIEMITNGDFLNVENIQELTSAGIATFLVNLYDDQKQVGKFDSLFAAAGSNNYILRHHYGGHEVNYGLTLNNRAGNCSFLTELHEPIAHPCFLPFYRLLIDWNGDYMLCCNDWSRKAAINANISNMSIKEFWLSSQMDSFRSKLMRGDRNMEPCRKCDINGTLHGTQAFEAFRKYLLM